MQQYGLATLLLAVLLPLQSPAREIRAGDSYDQVRRELGAPKGTFTHGSRQVLLYEKGLVE